jgi:hypothetical protein
VKPLQPGFVERPHLARRARHSAFPRFGNAAATCLQLLAQLSPVFDVSCSTKPLFFQPAKPSADALHRGYSPTWVAFAAWFSVCLSFELSYRLASDPLFEFFAIDEFWIAIDG